jgi:hypothetical protein
MLSNLLSCITRCIFANGGRKGDSNSVNRAALKARNTPEELTPADRELLMNVPLSYFYTAGGVNFADFKVSLWRCISECIKIEDPMPPKWFTSDRFILEIVLKGNN